MQISKDFNKSLCVYGYLLISLFLIVCVCIIISNGQRLIEINWKVFLTIYMCVLCIYCIYINSHMHAYKISMYIIQTIENYRNI